MKTNRFTSHKLLIFLIACAVIPSLITACQPTIASVDAVEEIPVSPTVQVPESIKQPVSINLELPGIAQGKKIETVAAVQPDDERPYWEILPEHLLVTLEDYRISNHMMKAHIFVYPVADLPMFNTGAATIAYDLKSLLEDQEVDEFLPFLPMFNAAQVMHSQVEFLDFKNGSGVRFLTQFDQGPLPINNMELIYTFQGLTSDNKYYVAAVFPINHADLPDTNQVIAQDESDLAEFPSYMKDTVAWLDQQPVSSFTPDLSTLDMLIQTIEVK
jgi:hypothetical protein